MTATAAGQARRTALFLLYQWDLTGQPLAALYEGVPDRSRASSPRRWRAAPASSTSGSARPRGLDRRPAGYARAEHPADRDPRARGGSVPPEVAINEAVVLAKRYASDEAARLVNGILGPRGARATEEAIDGVSRVGRRGTGKRAEELLERLEATREELERLAAAGRTRGGRRRPHRARGAREGGRGRAQQGRAGARPDAPQP